MTDGKCHANLGSLVLYICLWMKCHSSKIHCTMPLQSPVQAGVGQLRRRAESCQHNGQISFSTTQFTQRLKTSHKMKRRSLFYLCVLGFVCIIKLQCAISQIWICMLNERDLFKILEWGLFVRICCCIWAAAVQPTKRAPPGWERVACSKECEWLALCRVWHTMNSPFAWWWWWGGTTCWLDLWKCVLRDWRYVDLLLLMKRCCLFLLLLMLLLCSNT